MGVSSSTFRRSGVFRLLALLVVVAVGLQGAPLQALVHSLHAPTSHHQCSHPEGYCPMNPDGPCTCDHSRHADADGPDEPTLRPCSPAPADGFSVAVVGKWVLDRVGRTLTPHERPVSRTPMVSFLSSQRVGDRIFHPPRLPGKDRSGRPLPAPGHS